ncbi:c-type cytochrome [Pseudomonas fluvialis]|jgi:cytochrome c556|uniref:Cytochrome C n=1 Tax=Pseudomonas fluvialis TaxID=1793966 RepID=A0A2I0CL83_9PSED|nr:cytochrome c [Pseudomonas pharmacofabricae]MBP8264153.1 cytochrome c [Pseudomonas sp.]PKF69908.1 cytochrome C [Pseudomonas pharmacofabricae]
MKYPLVLLVLAGLGLQGCDSVDPNSPLGKRQALFKEMLRTSEDLGGMLRGRLPFDEQAFASGAVRLDELTAQPWQHFPQVRDEGDSRARDEVWQRQARFQELADAQMASTRALAEAAARPPLQAKTLAPLVARVEADCKACHSEFRRY